MVSTLVIGEPNSRLHVRASLLSEKSSCGNQHDHGLAQRGTIYRRHPCNVDGPEISAQINRDELARLEGRSEGESGSVRFWSVLRQNCAGGAERRVHILR
jgi:hypothetical protein